MFKTNLKTRVRWRTKIVGFTLIVFVSCLLSLPQAIVAMTPDDYDSSSLDAEASNGGETSHDIYEPALLQQEVEHSEHRTSSSFEDTSADTEGPERNRSSAFETTQSTIERMKEILKRMQSKKNMDAALDTKHKETKGRSNSMDSHMEYDMSYNKHDLKHQVSNSAEYYDDSTQLQSEKSPITTMTPEYERKGKMSQLSKHLKTPTQEDTVEGNLSASLDYVDDDQLHEQLLQRKRMHAMNLATTKRRINDDNGEPKIMRFYQNNEDMMDQREQEQQNNNNNVVMTRESLPIGIPLSIFNNDATWSIASTMDTPSATASPDLMAKTMTTTTPTTSPETSITALPPPTHAPEILMDKTFETPLLLGGFFPSVGKPQSALTPPTAVTTQSPLTKTANVYPLHDAATTASVPTTSVMLPIIPTTAATTTRPPSKQGKQINITRRKLLPHEQLRNYIEDAYIRMPIAVIVDPSKESLEKTKALWGDALRSNFNIKIVLVSLNGSGAPAAYNFNNTRQFLAGLNSIKEHQGGDAFIGIVHASELVPYDSAVFISTAMIPPHTELVQDAAITLLKKRIRLYLIWFGERNSSENETQEAVGGILGEVAIRSGGEILHIVGSDSSQEIEGNTLVLVADAFRGSQEIDVPVDTTLSSLHVKIDSPVRMATMETPHGDINLKKLVKFKSQIFTTDNPIDTKILDAFVPLTKLHKSAVYKLKIIPEDLEAEYSVFLRAERKADQFLNDLIKRFDTYFLEGISYYPTRYHDARMQSITSALATITMPTHDNLKFPEEMDTETPLYGDVNVNRKIQPKSEVETFSDTEIHRDTINDGDENNETDAEIVNNTIAADISKYINQQQRQSTSNLLQQSYTKIELASQSQVLVSPGMMSQLVFEVHNMRQDAVFYSIQVVDERRYLLRLSTTSLYLQPDTTATISVTLVVPSDAIQGITDRVTLSLRGNRETVSQSVNIRVLTNVDARDNTAPSLTYTYGSRCEYVPPDSATCAEHYWTVDITAQDWEAGILRLQTTPSNRLIYRNSYVIGTSDPIRATYVATCCEPKVTISAFDIAGNQRSITLDVRELYLTDAAIAAIVLGCILLLILIVLTIMGIVYCCRRRKIILDLPTYRSHSTRSME